MSVCGPSRRLHRLPQSTSRSRSAEVILHPNISLEGEIFELEGQRRCDAQNRPASTSAPGHSLQVLSRPLVNKCLLCINTDRKFWALEFVAMSQFQTHTVQRAERCGAHDL